MKATQFLKIIFSVMDFIFFANLFIHIFPPFGLFLNLFRIWLFDDRLTYHKSFFYSLISLVFNKYIWINLNIYHYYNAILFASSMCKRGWDLYFSKLTFCLALAPSFHFLHFSFFPQFSPSNHASN